MFDIEFGVTTPFGAKAGGADRCGSICGLNAVGSEDEVLSPAFWTGTDGGIIPAAPFMCICCIAVWYC